jgi:DNA-binding response OmpR family regulator
MLTALGGIHEKLEGFNSGADDYLLKPFEFSELIARINALLKRAKNEPNQGSTITVFNLEINRANKTVHRDGKKIELSVKEFSLLEYMVLNRNKLLTRNELTQNVWGINYDTGTNIVDVYINFLRKKMDTGYPIKLIHTKTGYGYLFTDDENNI